MFKLHDLSFSYGSVRALRGVCLSAPPGEVTCVIGRNGVGKTTLMKMIIGKELPDSGTIESGQTVKLAYVDQIRDALTGNHNVFQEVSGGLDILNNNGIDIHSRA